MGERIYIRSRYPAAVRPRLATRRPWGNCPSSLSFVGPRLTGPHNDGDSLISFATSFTAPCHPIPPIDLVQPRCQRRADQQIVVPAVGRDGPARRARRAARRPALGAAAPRLYPDPPSLP